MGLAVEARRVGGDPELRDGFRPDEQVDFVLNRAREIGIAFEVDVEVGAIALLFEADVTLHQTDPNVRRGGDRRIDLR